MKRLLFLVCTSIFAVGVFPLLSAEEPAPSPLPLSPAEAKLQEARAALGGRGMQKNPARALELMKEAADAGSADAVGGIGYFYAVGAGGVERDLTEAARWFRKGAEKGSAKAQLNLARALLNGNGLEKNEAEGIAWLAKAADSGLDEAQAQYGIIVYRGDAGIAKDAEAAVRYLKPAAEAGIPSAQNAYAFMLLNAEGGIGHDQERSMELFLLAANQGEAKAQMNYGTVLIERAKTQEEFGVALMWLNVAAGTGDPVAINILDASKAYPIEPGTRAKAEKEGAELRGEIQRQSLKRLAR